MADEITIRASMEVLKGSLEMRRTPPAFRATLAGTRYSGVIQSITTSVTALSIAGSVSAGGGWCWIRNCGANTVNIGRYDGSTLWSFVTLLPGEYTVFRAASHTMHAQAVGSTTELEHVLLQA
ncbi:MAG: hypothetical protein KF847_19730 [Pirellulales bacterium]|nr:hypothetical protein [Pirellulales bacterium]